MSQIYPLLFGYNYTGEEVEGFDGEPSRLSPDDRRYYNLLKVLSYIPIVNNIGAIAILILCGRDIVTDKYCTRWEKVAYISRLAIAATGLGIVFLPVDLIATLVKAVHYYRQRRTAPVI